jgi:hypothetical protein
MRFQWGNLREGDYLENIDHARCMSWSEPRISWCTCCFSAYHHQTYLQTHITTVLPYITGIKNQTLQGRDYRMSEILKSGIIFSVIKLSHISRFLTLQFPMKTVLHIKFRLRSQTGYIWWTMQLLFVLCEYWPQDELNMGWNVLSLHLEELTILTFILRTFNSVFRFTVLNFPLNRCAGLTISVYILWTEDDEIIK